MQGYMDYQTISITYGIVHQSSLGLCLNKFKLVFLSIFNLLFSASEIFWVKAIPNVLAFAIL